MRDLETQQPAPNLPDLPDTLVIMMGSPRSGTTWLHSMLGDHPDVCTTGELKVFDHFTSRWEESWNDLEDVVEGDLERWHGVGSVWSAGQLDAVMRNFAEEVYRTVMANRPEASVFLDKTPAYAAHVEHIDRLFPQARFIHVIRDGRDVAASMIAASRGWGSTWAASSVREAAIRWRDYVRGGLIGRSLGDRYLELRYEDLLEDGRTGLRRCLDLMDMETDDAWIADVLERFSIARMKSGTQVSATGRPLPKGFIQRGSAGGWLEDLSPRDRYEFNRLAGSLLEDLGYAEPGWWADSGGARLMVKIQRRSDRARRQTAARSGMFGALHSGPVAQ